MNLMFAHFRFAGLRPAPIPQHIARQTQQWAPHERHATTQPQTHRWTGQESRARRRDAARRVLPPGVSREACSACGRLFTRIYQCICKDEASWFTQCTAYGGKIPPKTQAERDLLHLKGKMGKTSAGHRARRAS